MSAHGHDVKKAPIVGAFFIAWCLFIGPALASECQTGPIDEWVEIKTIFDGDTVQLVDGRKIRLIGINTPELDHEFGRHEPLAVAARQYLQMLIGQARTIGLHFGEQRQDRYHRQLAHVILDGKVDVQQQLLQQGLAFAITIPPNLFNQTCYQQAEDIARRQHSGVWGERNYRPHDLAFGKPVKGGFQILKSKVLRVNEAGSAVWLGLDGGVAVRIADRDQRYFAAGNDFRRWRGRCIQVRGWLYRHKHQWRMNIRHPQNIEIVYGSGGR